MIDGPDFVNYVDYQDLRGKRYSAFRRSGSYSNNTVPTPTRGGGTREEKLVRQIAEGLSHRGIDVDLLAFHLDKEPPYVIEGLAGLIGRLLDLWRMTYASGVVPPTDPLYATYQDAAIMMDTIESGGN